MQVQANFPNELRKTEQELTTFSPETLSDFFSSDPGNIIEVGKDAYLFFERKNNPRKSRLHGTIFLADLKRVIRGFPKMEYVPSDSMSKSESVLTTERSICNNPPISFEEKINGINFRVFLHNREFRFATRQTYDGVYGENWASYARRITAPSPGLFDLVKEGYVPVIEVTSPDFKDLTGERRNEGFYLIELIRDHRFVPITDRQRLAKERGLKTPRLMKVVDSQITPEELESICIRLNQRCLEAGIEGVVVKSDEGSDISFLKSKPKKERFGLKDAISNCLSGYYNELGVNVFSEGNAWNMLLAELSEDFIIKPTNIELIKLRYGEFLEFTKRDREAQEKARLFLGSNKPTSRKELAELAKSERIQGRVKHWVFELYRQSPNLVPDTNFFHTYSVRENNKRHPESSIRPDEQRFIDSLECVLPTLRGRYICLPQVRIEFQKPSGTVTVSDVYSMLGVEYRDDLRPTEEHVNSVFSDIQKTREELKRKRFQIPKIPGSKNDTYQKEKDLKDAKVIAEYECLYRDSSSRDYTLISAEESVATTVNNRGGTAIRF